MERRPTVGDSKWFQHDRFGLFIHWGLYALPARHEWVKQYEQTPDDVYQRYFDHFDPDLYDPEAWAAAAANAGMKYGVITTKHHEGFCLWDSKLTDYKATNTPAKRDLIKPFVEAFRRFDLRVGFYHSLIDWHHPDFTVDDVHVLRNAPDRAKLNEGRDMARYRAYLHGQVRELLTQYGKISVLFYDFSYPPHKGRADWDSQTLLRMTRELQPGVLVDDRLDLHDVEGGWDYRTPEQVVPREGVMVNGVPVVWEACHTMSGSWGYHRDEATWKSAEQLIILLIDTVGKGGNLLLNVGPTGRGEFDHRAMDRLQAFGEWMKRHSRAIYGCGQAPADIPVPEDCRLTYNAETNRLYVHVLAWPFKYLHLDRLAGRVAYAQLLNDASEVKMTQRVPEASYGAMTESREPGTLTLELPILKPRVTIPVIELFLK